MSMTQEQFFSIVRAVLGTVGGLLVGTGVVTQDGWATDAGALMSVASLLWSWVHHGLTIDLLLGAIRNCGAMLGGFAASKGWATSDQVASITGAALSIASIVWAHQSKKPPTRQ